MKIRTIDPPRAFSVGGVTISDCGRVALAPDEQITLTTESGGEVDVTRKDWGFYLGPSLNARLAGFGLRAVLVKNSASGKFNVFAVERGREPAFDAYLVAQGHAVVAWLDTDEALAALEARLRP